MAGVGHRGLDHLLRDPRPVRRDGAAVSEQVPEAWTDRLLEVLGAMAAAHQQQADAAGRVANWITSEATMDEASFALSRALHPKVEGQG